MKIIIWILLIFFFYSCNNNNSNNNGNSVTADMEFLPPPPPPPAPRRRIIDLKEGDSINRKLFNELRDSKNDDDIVDALYLANYFSDTTFIKSCLKLNGYYTYFIFDLGQSSTIGELAFSRFFEPKDLFSNKDDRIKFCLSVIQNKDLWHIHELAGSELEKIVNLKRNFNQFYAKWLNFYNAIDIGYILFKMNYKEGGTFGSKYEFPLDSEQLSRIIYIIKNKNLKKETRLFLFDYLYASIYSQKTGQFVFNKINKFPISKEEHDYNLMLYSIYIKQKALFEKLDSIHTWKEMDKERNSIIVLFDNPHPMMFYQILYFNPSTVIDSKQLSELKFKAIKEMLIKSNTNSFYKTFTKLLKYEMRGNNSLPFVFSNSEKAELILLCKE